jgi:hypothetical protein
MQRWIIGSLLLGTAAVLALTGAGRAVAGKDKKSETIKLFNGKDLDGWEGYKDLWSVKDGAIVAKNDKPLKVSTYLFTKGKYRDFRLVFSAKLGEINEMHSGVAIWGRKLPAAELEKKEKGLDAAKEHGEYTYQGHLVMFPSGWGLFDLYRRFGLKVPNEMLAAEKKAGKQHDWNDMEILAIGDRIKLAVNGHAVLDWKESDPKMISEGPIALQLHSNGKAQEVLFKGLELTTFPEDKLLTVKGSSK